MPNKDSWSCPCKPIICPDCRTRLWNLVSQEFCPPACPLCTGGVEYGSVEALYKLPFLEMFNDIEVLLDNGGISDLDIVALYKIISDVTREDCTICNNNPELNDLSIHAAKVRVELEVYVGTLQFKPKAIERTTETKNKVQNLPNSLKIKVEPTSSILENIENIDKKGK